MDSLTLAVVGAAYGTSLALGFGRRARVARSLPDGLLSTTIAVTVVAITTIVLQHRLSGPVISVLERIEYVGSLAVGPLILFYVRSTIDGGRERGFFPLGSVVHLLPAMGALVLPSAGGDPLLGMPIQLVMLHQISYTVAASVTRARGSAIPGVHGTLSIALLGVMGIVHLAQITRYLGRTVPSLEDVVPVTISLVMMSAGGVALWRVMRARPRPARVRTAGNEAEPAGSLTDQTGLLSELERLMSDDHIYRDPAIGLHDLAERLGVSSHQLSSELNEKGDVSLTAYLASWRLEDAKRRLLDPDHEIYTVDGIAEMSGFGSRSSFYSTFKRETGMTPARFRRNSPEPG